MHSYLPDFSHIYIESQAFDYELTHKLVNRFPKATKVEIGNYKDVFNRAKQDWQLQKKSQKLVLAVKRSDFFYRGSAITPNFGHQNFYYNTLAMNCLYDCSYCYLQGMYSSANIVVFVNNEDFLLATANEIKNCSPMYLCISYDTDLLAMEGMLSYCRQWISFAAQHSDLTIELRTKSANYASICDLKPQKNVVLAWTLSPQTIGKSYEDKAPSLTARLSSINKACKDGWNVRLCFDPLLRIGDWKNIYTDFFSQVFSCVSAEQIKDISLGTFRINSQYFERMVKNRPHSDLMYFPYAKKDGIVGYHTEQISEMNEFISLEIRKHAPQQQIFTI